MIRQITYRPISLLLTMSATACSSSTLDVIPPRDAGADVTTSTVDVDAHAPDAADATDAAHAADAASCIILAETFDRTCTDDSDCVAVIPGGNLCDPCKADSACLRCKLDVLSANGARDFADALAAAGGVPSALQADGGIDRCVTSSCPVLLKPSCSSGTCVITGESDGGWGAQCGRQ